MSSRSKTSLFPKFGMGKKDHDNFLIFNEKDYFNSPQPASNRVSDSKKESRKSKKQLALRRNLQAEKQNKDVGTTTSPVDQCTSPDLQFDESANSPDNTTTPDDASNDQVDKENTLSGSGGQKKNKNMKKSMRQTLSTWRQKLRKSTMRRSPLITDTPGGCSPGKVNATPTSHVKLYSPFCIDTPSQPTIREKIDVHYAKPRRFTFSSPGRSKKSVSDGIQCLASLADGLDAALGCKE